MKISVLPMFIGGKRLKCHEQNENVCFGLFLIN